MAGKMGAFIWAYVRSNLAVALEYRISTLSQIVGMMLNNVLWVIFWMLYFNRFPVIKGWRLEDVMVLWACVTTSAGIAMGVTGNSMRIPQLVVQGQLDYYLTLPKDVLLHLLVSHLRLVNLGDLLFGPLLLILMVKLTWVKVVVYVATTLLAAVVMLAFFVLTGSLVFYVGHAEQVSTQMNFAMIHFSTYPSSIFDVSVRVLLFTLIPAGFISTLPVELVREFHWTGFLELLGAAALFMVIAVATFRRGLRRYESGSLIEMRS